MGQSGFDWSLEHLLDRPPRRIDRLLTHLQVVLARRAVEAYLRSIRAWTSLPAADDYRLARLDVVGPV